VTRPAKKAALLAAFFLLMLLEGAPARPQDAPPAIHIAPGSGSFAFVDAKGDASKTMTVYTYLPKELPARSARIVFVMHGVGKNAAGARNAWIEPAERYGLLVIAPLFDRAQWSRGGYSYASVLAPDGKPRDASLWSFSVIEHLFDAIKLATGNPAASYFLYGHSEGGQFVHRLVLLLPEARYARAVAANAGWYMMPAFDVRYPYGLGGAPVTRESLGKSLGRDVVIMLGELDRDPNHSQLRRTPGAMAQGTNRYERGETFFREARDRAKELGSAFGWRIQPVPGAAHENSKMSRAAAAVLMER
jgi:poly(3-hydroxybutyrate) depolymerase